MNELERAARRNVASLEAGELLEDEIFLVSQKELRTTNNGGLYIHAVLVDKTGEILARMWNASKDIYLSIPERGFARFRGRVESYKGKPQFIIDGIRPAEPHEIDMADFMPATQRDIEQMWERLKQILRGVKNRHLLALAAKFINDEQFVAGFKQAPAATKNHHAFVGGLLEHTLSLLELALVVIPRYPHVSLDLVLVGILLHDAGKMRELSCNAGFDYTTEGKLVGHIVLGVLWLHEKAREMEAQTREPFPIEIENALKHIILAHHGKYEFGSPRLPATMEAVAVHYLDNLDAKLQQFQFEIERDIDQHDEWTAYMPSLATKIYKPDVMGIRPKPDSPQ
jgi:3'-5' exoribonuclease